MKTLEKLMKIKGIDELNLPKSDSLGESVEEHAKNLYLSDEYIKRYPSLHEENSPWKVSKILPLIDELLYRFDKNEINLLDVGGGAGLILSAVSTYIEQSYNIKVNKFALDMSPGILEIQKKRNPDLKKALKEDICKTSLASKEVDVTLLIDLLEHVSNPTEALKEVGRISKFAIFKVPLECSPFCGVLNFITWGATKSARELIGHINVYNFYKLMHQIEKNTGYVMDFSFTNMFDYFLASEYCKRNLRRKLVNSIAECVFRLSPKLCSFIFEDFVIILVKCYSA
jgi:ubiquinone/menaquinone biosynthesis C-methylase UbiE